MVRTHVSRTGGTSLSWWSDSKEAGEDGASTSKRSRSVGKASSHSGGGKNRGRR